MTRRIAFLLGVLCATASAQPAPAPAQDPADVALAEGRRLYDLREFRAAIGRFKEAYRIRPDAASLFNIAQSYRLLGDCANAYYFYTTFQRNFPKERPEIVANFIQELEPCKNSNGPTGPMEGGPTGPGPTVKADKPPDKPVDKPVDKPTPIAPKPVEPVVPDEPAPPGRTMRIAGIAVGGVGIAALGTGVFFGLRARSQSKDLNSSDEWNPSLDASAHRADRNAKILLGVGGAAVIGGAVLFYLGYRAGAESSQVALVPSADGATLAWSIRFQ